MHNEINGCAQLILELSRAIERDLLGCKIPDLIVDRLIHEIPILNSYMREALLHHINISAKNVAKAAYELWMAGELSCIGLFKQIDTTFYPYAKNYGQADSVVAFKSLDFAV